jgi:hypothetical protein
MDYIWHYIIGISTSVTISHVIVSYNHFIHSFNSFELIVIRVKKVVIEMIESNKTLNFIKILRIFVARMAYTSDFENA